MEHPRKGSSARGARRGIFLERGEQRLHDSLGKLGAPSARVGRRLGQVREPDLGYASPREGRLAGEALVEDAAEGIDVALPRRLLSFDQLRCEVVRRAEQLAVRGQARRVGAAREAEVGERCGALAVEQHVRRLDVAVQDAPDVERVEPAPELGRELGCLVDPERPQRLQPQGQRAARVERHRQVGPAL